VNGTQTESEHTSFHNNKSGHVIPLFRVSRCDKVNGIVVFVIKPFVLDIIRIIKQSDVEVTSHENQAESQIIAKILCAIRTDVLKR